MFSPIGMTRRAPAPLAWLAGLLAIYLIAPLVAGARQAVLADWSSVDAGALLHACAVSVASASLATLIIALGGIPLGYLLARVRGRTMAVLGFLVQLPLALPPLTSGVLLLFLVGYSMPLGRLFGGGLTDSFAGIVLAEVFVAAPFLIIAARSGFAAMDPVLESVAATLGRGPFAIFFRVSLPIAWPTILSGLLLAWLRAFGEFGATVMVAYHPYSLPVYTYVAFGAQGLPAMLPVLLPTLVLALLIMALTGVAARQSRLPNEPPPDTIAAPVASRSGEARPPLRLTGPTDISFQLEKQLGGFRLEVAWWPSSRRLAILGPSGSGKSLILRLIAGIERCDKGSVIVGERELSLVDPAARGIAYVPQSYGLFPHLTLLENVRFAAGADPDAALYWIDRLGLSRLEQRRPAALSLGQQQRAALARALVRPSGLLLLDEPFSALDAPLRARLRRQLLALQAEFTATTILVTHDPLEAALLADEVLVLKNGRALQSGPTEQVFRRPANEAVARLLGADNVAEGIVAGPHQIAVGNGLTVEAAGPPLPKGDRVGWSFSPSRARLSPTGPYQGQVDGVASMGVGRQITVRFGDARVRIFDGQTDAPLDAVCDFDIDPNSIQVWPVDRDST
jgi:ABC-type Fe3+/spermidine/putrescine transport system ATPase subunit/ABC-type sulfate transport system permease component